MRTKNTDKMHSKSQMLLKCIRFISNQKINFANTDINSMVPLINDNKYKNRLL